MSGPRSNEQRLRDHVERLVEEHPPIDLAGVDFTIRDQATTDARFGHVLDYMARVQLEVDRNVLELTTMLPDPPEADRHFYADVWHPREIRHGEILDELQVRLGRPPAVTDARRSHPRCDSSGCWRTWPPCRTWCGCSTTSPARPRNASGAGLQPAARRVRMPRPR